MPPGSFESQVLRLLAANRSPESFVAGASVLNQSPDSPRTSPGIDIFHDAEAQLARNVARDLETLRGAHPRIAEESRNSG